jgi:arylsulfatase A-like enzyme
MRVSSDLQYGAQGAMRDGDWKLVLSGKEQPTAELFDLSKDLGEAENLATKQPDRLEKMKNAYFAWLKDVESGATEQP